MRRRFFLFGLGVAMGCNFAQEFQLPPAAERDAAPPESTDPSETLIPEDGGTCGNTQSDANNCGVCGHSCLGGACSAGRCQPLVLASGLRDRGDSYNATGPSLVTADASHAYWINGGSSLMRVPVMGGAAEHVATLWESSGGVKLTVTSDAVFALSSHDFVRVAKSDRSVRNVVDRSIVVKGFVLSGEDVFFIAGLPPTAIYRCPLPACSPSLPSSAFVSKKSWEKTWYYKADKYYFTGIAASGEWIFVSVRKDEDSTQLWTLDRDTGDSRAYIDGLGPRYAYPLADATHVFAANVNYISSTPIATRSDTASRTRYVVSGVDVSGVDYGGFSLDDNYVYWHQPITNRVVRCAKEGCIEPEVLWTWDGKPDGSQDPRCANSSIIGSGINANALFFTTCDGRVMKLAKPPTKKPLPPTR